LPDQRPELLEPHRRRREGLAAYRRNSFQAATRATEATAPHATLRRNGQPASSMPTTPSATIAIRAGSPLSIRRYPNTDFLPLLEAALSRAISHSGTSLGAARAGQQGVAGAEPVEEAGLVVPAGRQLRRQPHDDHRQHVLDVHHRRPRSGRDAARG